jgi:ribonuclease VapC
MSKVVLDASAILAILNDEPGAEKITPALLNNATASTVNMAEVHTCLVREGVSPEKAWDLALDWIPDLEPFTREHAKIAGDLVQVTTSLSLSLGDRACLALAIALDAPVYTTDRLWKKLRLGIPVILLR